MAKIKVKKLKPGMTLIADVCDPNGRFLLGKDSVLTNKHIQALIAWGVVSVELDDNDVIDEHGDDSTSSESIEQSKKELLQLFILNDTSHPFISELIDSVSEYLCKHD